MPADATPKPLFPGCFFKAAYGNMIFFLFMSVACPQREELDVTSKFWRDADSHHPARLSSVYWS